ncbi:trichohyalin-like [Papaver somniferum]|uniref:trichohyalin-like n=1 Tax=Papaver somniferum TaxID=3469 RepID=UPI000E700663|nr:trichohyalin-like [Papaver somniferum]
MLASDKCKVAPDDSISLPEFNHEELKTFLEFLYRGNLAKEKFEKHFYSLTVAADKYVIPHLHKFCEQQLLNSLDSTNALKVLEISELCSNETLKLAALRSILQYKNRYLLLPYFEEFAKQNPHLMPEQERNNDISYDRVSVHTSETSSTGEETQRTGIPGTIDGNEEDMTIAELTQRFIAERRRDDEENANLIRQNDDLREENLRLHEQRSRSATRSRSRSRSRSRRSSSKQSQFNHENDRQRHRMEVIEENSQENNNSHDQQERRRTIQDRGTEQYEHPCELLRRTHHNLEREEDDPRQKQMMLHGREMVRNQYEREKEITRARDERNKQRRREEIEEREVQEALRQNNHDNRLRRRERYHMDDTEKRRDGEERHDIMHNDVNIERERRRRRREEDEECEIQEAMRQLTRGKNGNAMEMLIAPFNSLIYMREIIFSA